MAFQVSVSRATPFLEGVGYDVCCPFFDAADNLHYILQDSGEIINIDQSGSADRLHSTEGQPSGAAFDSQGSLYVADLAHAAVLTVHPGDGQQELVVGVYEDKPLKGPYSIVSSQGSLFFTDSGPFGETGLHSTTGSLFAISSSPSGQILRPISLENLAAPTGVAVSPDGRFIYVAEMMRNRVLRYFQQPEGVYHGSVFYQLSGSVGPAALAVDPQGTIYVGQYETRDATSEGIVYVISPGGKLEANIIVPGPEISGLAISENHLYITEKSTGSIYRAAL